MARLKPTAVFNILYLIGLVYLLYLVVSCMLKYLAQ